MIKIIKRPEELKTKEIKCPCCGCTLEYDEYDVSWDKFTGALFVNCPNCATNITIEPEEHIPAHWPEGFYEYSVDKNAVKLKDETIQQYINQCVEYTKKNKEIRYVASGDTFIITLPDCNDDGGLEEVTAIVARGYKEGLMYVKD